MYYLSLTAPNKPVPDLPAGGPLSGGELHHNGASSHASNATGQETNTSNSMSRHRHSLWPNPSAGGASSPHGETAADSSFAVPSPSRSVGKMRGSVGAARQQQQQQQEDDSLAAAHTSLTYSPDPRNHHHSVEEEKRAPIHSSAPRTVFTARSGGGRAGRSSSPSATGTTAVGSPAAAARNAATLRRALADAEALAGRLAERIAAMGGDPANPLEADGGPTALQIADAKYRREHMYMLTSGAAAYTRKKVESAKLLQAALAGRAAAVAASSSSPSSPFGGGGGGHNNYTQTARGNRGWAANTFNTHSSGSGNNRGASSSKSRGGGGGIATADGCDGGEGLLDDHRRRIGLSQRTAKCALCDVVYATDAMGAAVSYKLAHEIQQRWRAQWAQQLRRYGHLMGASAAANGGGGDARRRSASPIPSYQHSNSNNDGGRRSRSPSVNNESASTSAVLVGWAAERRDSRARGSTVSQAAKARPISNSPAVMYGSVLLCRFCAQHAGVTLGEPYGGGYEGFALSSSTDGNGGRPRSRGGSPFARSPTAGRGQRRAVSAYGSFRGGGGATAAAAPAPSAPEVFAAALQTTRVAVDATDVKSVAQRHRIKVAATPTDKPWAGSTAEEARDVNGDVGGDAPDHDEPSNAYSEDFTFVRSDDESLSPTAAPHGATRADVGAPKSAERSNDRQKVPSLDLQHFATNPPQQKEDQHQPPPQQRPRPHTAGPSRRRGTSGGSGRGGGGGGGSDAETGRSPSSSPQRTASYSDVVRLRAALRVRESGWGSARGVSPAAFAASSAKQKQRPSSAATARRPASAFVVRHTAASLAKRRGFTFTPSTAATAEPTVEAAPTATKLPSAPHSTKGDAYNDEIPIVDDDGGSSSSSFSDNDGDGGVRGGDGVVGRDEWVRAQLAALPPLQFSFFGGEGDSEAEEEEAKRQQTTRSTAHSPNSTVRSAHSAVSASRSRCRGGDTTLTYAALSSPPPHREEVCASSFFASSSSSSSSSSRLINTTSSFASSFSRSPSPSPSPSPARARRRGEVVSTGGGNEAVLAVGLVSEDDTVAAAADHTLDNSNGEPKTEDSSSLRLNLTIGDARRAELKTKAACEVPAARGGGADNGDGAAVKEKKPLLRKRGQGSPSVPNPNPSSAPERRRGDYARPTASSARAASRERSPSANTAAVAATSKKQPQWGARAAATIPKKASETAQNGASAPSEAARRRTLPPNDVSGLARLLQKSEGGGSGTGKGGRKTSSANGKPRRVQKGTAAVEAKAKPSLGNLSTHDEGADGVAKGLLSATALNSSMPPPPFATPPTPPPPTTDYYAYHTESDDDGGGGANEAAAKVFAQHARVQPLGPARCADGETGAVGDAAYVGGGGGVRPSPSQSPPLVATAASAVDGESHTPIIARRASSNSSSSSLSEHRAVRSASRASASSAVVGSAVASALEVAHPYAAVTASLFNDDAVDENGEEGEFDRMGSTSLSRGSRLSMRSDESSGEDEGEGDVPLPPPLAALSPRSQRSANALASVQVHTIEAASDILLTPPRSAQMRAAMGGVAASNTETAEYVSGSGVPPVSVPPPLLRRLFDGSHPSPSAGDTSGGGGDVPLLRNSASGSANWHSNTGGGGGGASGGSSSFNNPFQISEGGGGMLSPTGTMAGPSSPSLFIMSSRAASPLRGAVSAAADGVGGGSANASRAATPRSVSFRGTAPPTSDAEHRVATPRRAKAKAQKESKEGAPPPSTSSAKSVGSMKKMKALASSSISVKSAAGVPLQSQKEVGANSGGSDEAHQKARRKAARREKLQSSFEAEAKEAAEDRGREASSSALTSLPSSSAQASSTSASSLTSHRKANVLSAKRSVTLSNGGTKSSPTDAAAVPQSRKGLRSTSAATAVSSRKKDASAPPARMGRSKGSSKGSLSDVPTSTSASLGEMPEASRSVTSSAGRAEAEAEIGAAMSSQGIDIPCGAPRGSATR